METKEQPIVLVLTRDEAKTLRDVTCFISGAPNGSRRKHTDSIQTQLAELGFGPLEYTKTDIDNDSDIRFK